MAYKAKRKRRVRKHIIADLSLHYVAYPVVKCGFTIEPTSHDYGYDCSIVTYRNNGEVENGSIFVQLKATDQIERHRTKRGLRFSVSRKDINLWGGEPFPVYLVLFDAKNEKAYWIYFQKYLKENSIAASRISSSSLSVNIDRTSELVPNSPVVWRADKQKILDQMRRVDHA